MIGSVLSTQRGGEKPLDMRLTQARTRHLGIRVDEHVWDQLHGLAADHDVSVSDVVRRAIADYLGER
jgi:hypothetical protein